MPKSQKPRKALKADVHKPLVGSQSKAKFNRFCNLLPEHLSAFDLTKLMRVNRLIHPEAELSIYVDDVISCQGIEVEHVCYDDLPPMEKVWNTPINNFAMIQRFHIHINLGAFPISKNTSRRCNSVRLIAAIMLKAGNNVQSLIVSVYLKYPREGSAEHARLVLEPLRCLHAIKVVFKCIGMVFPWKDIDVSDDTFLQQLRHDITSSDPTWGFVVYRTVYTEKSDTEWDSFNTKLRQYVLCGLGSDDPESWDGKDRYQFTIREDRKLFHNASYSTLREHFRSNKDDNDEFQSRDVFLVFDEEVFQVVLKANPNEQADIDMDFPWVKAATATYEQDTANGTKMAEVIKVGTVSLWEYFESLEDRNFCE
jgi:hypothetical protein